MGGGQTSITGEKIIRRGTIAGSRRLPDYLNQLKRIKNISFLVLTIEGFSDIDKLKAAHEKIKFESKPKLEVWSTKKINQLIADEGL